MLANDLYYTNCSRIYQITLGKLENNNYLCLLLKRLKIVDDFIKQESLPTGRK